MRAEVTDPDLLVGIGLCHIRQPFDRSDRQFTTPFGLTNDASKSMGGNAANPRDMVIEKRCNGSNRARVCTLASAAMD